MTPRPSHGKAPGNASLLRSIGGCIAAVVLPWLCTLLSITVPALRGTPLALGFAAVVSIAYFGGNIPGLLSAAVTALAFNHFLMAQHGWLTFTAIDTVHTVVILALGVLIASLSERQRITGYRLRTALHSLEARTDALIQAQQGSNSAAWMYNVRENRLRWAEGGAPVMGRRFSDLDPIESVLQIVALEDRERVKTKVWTAIQAGERFHVEFRVQLPSGETRWLESRGTASAFDPQIWHGVTVDVTERKSAEFALVRSEKLAAIGRLSATIAHEINNPLEAVTNLLFLALTEPDLPPRARTYLEHADRELARLATIARRTLSFVRPRSSTGPVRVNEVVDSVIEMFQPRCSSRGGEIQTVRTTDLTLAVSADELRQVLTNLVSNACDAIPESGGIIEVEVEQHAEIATICVRDNGSGISPESLNRVFEAFFTTKPDVGTGIGLWVTKDLVEKNGGRIYVKTAEPPARFRTTFCIDFPIPEAAMEPATTQP